MRVCRFVVNSSRVETIKTEILMSRKAKEESAIKLTKLYSQSHSLIKQSFAAKYKIPMYLL